MITLVQAADKNKNGDEYFCINGKLVVISVLEKANSSSIEGSAEEEQILDPLKLKKLYNKSVKNLSGGELQKVAIASCLLQKVDLYALDEPSAFLDVEDFCKSLFVLLENLQ